MRGTLPPTAGPSGRRPGARSTLLLGAALCSALLLALALVLSPRGAQARVQAETAATEGYIDPYALQSHTPHYAGLDDPALERAVQKLRAIANSAPPSRRSARPARAPSDPTPAEAAWQMGLLALHGKAMPVDTMQAQYWFQRAQALGHPLAAAGLAWCHIDGCAGPPDPAAARPWITQLYSVDPGRALYLEWLVESRLAPLHLAPPQVQDPPPPEPPPHRGLLARAARAGNAYALNELALENTTAGRLELALQQFNTAADRSEAAAANARLLAGRIDARAEPPPRHTARQWFLDAQRYHRGDGVPANYAEAIRLYQVASASGSREAQRMLALIYSRPAANGVVDIAWMQQLAQLDVSRDGASPAPLPPLSPQIFVREPTPLYDLLGPPWRAAPKPRR